jgi:Flp pilus assembly protein TadG
MKRVACPSHSQRGAATVEFSLIAIVTFILLFAVLEMGRLLFIWNAASEATRYGARVAAVCNMNDSSALLSRMQRIMPNLTSGNLNITYLPSGCNKSNCLFVRVSIVSFQVKSHIPVVGTSLNLPPFSTTLPRESLESTNSAGEPNPLCN